jgi:hypothetical protein
MIVLDKVFRQKDSSFLRLLNELRRGIVSHTTQQILNQKVQENKQKVAFKKASSLHRDDQKAKQGIVLGQGNGTKDGEEMEVRPTKLYATNR